MNFLSPVFNEQTFDANGDPLVGGKVYTYAAGTSTPLQTYTTQNGVVQHSNPIILDARGEPPNPIWFLGSGQEYKFQLHDANDNLIRTIDDVAGINDVTATSDEWITFPLTPTYINATSFSFSGDQTLTFSIGRRIRTANTGGTIYSTITNSVFSSDTTTITVVNDSGVLDSGLSVVAYGILSPVNPSVPNSDSARRTMGFIPLTGYISGLTMSTAGSSATMTIATGQAADATGVNTIPMRLASSIAKTTSAWAVGSGNGGLDTGTIANATWYYFYLIRRPDTGVVDVIFSTSTSSPALPANYTQYRYIGAALTNGSAQWTRFFQVGNFFEWDAPRLDVSASVPSSAYVLRLVSVPRKEGIIGTFNCRVVGPSGASDSFFAGSPSISSLSGAFIASVEPSTSQGAQFECGINSSGQIATQMTNGGTGSTLTIYTTGWTDLRGSN